MPRRSMIIFDEPDIAGTVLFPISFLKSTTLGAAVEKFSSAAAGVLTPRSSHSELPFGVGFAGQSCVAKPFRGFGALFRRLACRDIADRCCESTNRVVSRSMRRPAYTRGAYGEVIRIAGSRSMLPDPLFLTVLIVTMLACYRLKTRRHAPGLTPTVCLK